MHDDVEMAYETIVGFQPRAAIFVTETWDELINRLEGQAIQVISLGRRGAASISTRSASSRRRTFSSAATHASPSPMPRRAARLGHRHAGRTPLPRVGGWGSTPRVSIVPRDGTGAAEIVRELARGRSDRRVRLQR